MATLSEGKRYQLKPKKKKDEDSEGRRHAYKKPKDEESEGKRYSYKKKAPKRRSEEEQKDDLRRRRVRTIQTERIYKDIPHPRRPIQDLSENPPERRPRPMQSPRAGPTEDLEEITAHRYGYTPEAYKELRRLPVRVAPAETDEESRVAGYYSPTKEDERIYINSGSSSDQGGRGTTLAHEQSHAWWNKRGMNDGTVPEAFNRDFSRWRDEQPSNRESQYSKRQMDSAINLGLYDEGQRPTETHARVTEFSPNSMPEGWEQYPITDRNDWPDEIRPYYSGFLQGMDTLSTGEPTPPLQTIDPSIMPPDENGNYGQFFPPRRW